MYFVVLIGNGIFSVSHEILSTYSSQKYENINQMTYMVFCLKNYAEHFAGRQSTLSRNYYRCCMRLTE